MSNKVFKLVSILLFSAISAFANQVAIVDCKQGGQVVVTQGLTSTTKVFQSFPSCQIDVFNHGTVTHSTIYSDNNNTVLANPYTAQNLPYSGAGFFYAANGHYDITISGGGILTPITFSDIILNDFAQATFGVCNVTFSATPTFNLSICNVFTMTLTGNVTSSAFSFPNTGQPIIFQLKQDATGGRTFACPTGFIVCPQITPAPNSTSSFYAYSDGLAYHVVNGDQLLSYLGFPSASNERKCVVDGMVCDGVTDDVQAVNRCIVNAKANGQNRIRLPGACKFLIQSAAINATNFPGLQIVGGGEDENVLFATAPNITQGICNTAATTNVCLDATGSGKFQLEHVSFISQNSQTHPSTDGVVQGRDNAAGGGNGLYCYSENALFFDVSIAMDHMPAANGGAGSVAIYNVGSERPTYFMSGTTADIGTFLAPTNDLGVVSPYQTLQTGCPTSMTFPHFINSYSQVIGSGPGILVDAVSGGNIVGHDFVGTSSASTGPAMQFQTSASTNWTVNAASETFNGGTAIGGTIATSVNLSHMKFDLTHAGLTNGPDQGFFWFGANNLVMSDVDLRVNSVLNGASNSQIISNNGTGQTWKGGSIEMAGTLSPLNASNTTLVGTRVVAYDFTQANITFNAASTYSLIANDMFGSVGPYKNVGSINATGGFLCNSVAAANTFLKGDGSKYCSGSPVLASADFANQGTTTTVLHGNAAGNPSFGAVSLTADVSGLLPGTNGGTGVSSTAVFPTTGTINTGTGTNNTIPKFTTGATGIIGNSSLVDNAVAVVTTEPFQIGSQSAAAPAYSFSSDTTTGLFLISVGNLGVSLGTALRVQFTNTEIRMGNGIGLGWSSNSNPAAAGPDRGFSVGAGANEIDCGNGGIGDTTCNFKLGKITGYNSIATVSNGVPSEYATVDLTAQTGNISATTLYAVPSSGAGMYRVQIYITETTAGSITSTLPNAQIVYTDKDSSTVVTIDATPVLGVAGIGQTGALTANTVGTTSTGVIVISAKASTNIQYQTVNYASNAAGMAYAIHVKLEAL